MKPNAPLARKDSLIVKDLPEETLVYDKDSDKAHCLNPTAAAVWKNCDGRKTVNEIARTLGGDSNSKVNEDIVWLALDQLENFKLLENPLPKPARLAGLSRRQVVRTLGVAAIVLPMVTTIVAPTSAQTGSGVPPGGCCVSFQDCQPGQDCKQELPGDPPCVNYPNNPQNSGKYCT